MHTIFDWLDLHDLKAPILRDIVTAYYLGELKDYHSKVEELPTSSNAAPIPESQAECFETYVIPALVEGFPECLDIVRRLQGLGFKELADLTICWPYTADRGEGQPPLVAMNWNGQPTDLMCLANKAAHALQIMLSGNDSMPPIARETCAFIGELLLLSFVQKYDPALYPELEQVWAVENAAYLFDNLDSLADGLLNPGTLYHYYMNYPLARLAAVQIFVSDNFSLKDLFSSGASAMKHLPIKEMAAQTAILAKYFPEPDPNVRFTDR